MANEFSKDRLLRQTAPPELDDPANLERWRLIESDGRGPYMIELNVTHVDGLAGAAAAFRAVFTGLFDENPPETHAFARISKTYVRCRLAPEEWKHLIAADQAAAAALARGPAPGSTRTPSGDEHRYRSIYRLWPDFPVQAHISRSVATIKADAALRSFDATGENIVWAVIDSGVEASHPHFGREGDHALDDPAVHNLHRCFVDVGGAPLPDPDEELIDPATRASRLDLHRKHALSDPMGHGTHVAGIIAGQAPDGVETVVLEREQRVPPGQEDEGTPTRIRTVTTARAVTSVRERQRFHGVAPGCRMVSLRVLDENGVGRSSDIVRALEHIREKLNDNPKLLRVHGVNLSVGYDFEAEMFACGQSPLCTEVNRLVQAGVVVVAAAGNTGYSTVSTLQRVTKVGLASTINDPGNAELAITVGSTHRESPHTFGVSYFSSKGPTGDGRLKPDLVAPGERILSCAAGATKTTALQNLLIEDGEHRPTADAVPDETVAYYVEDSGTSMASPHVSGAVAAFLSIRREFIGRPLDVKRIFLDSAIPLGRERYFEGHGLVDLMRAIQSV